MKIVHRSNRALVLSESYPSSLKPGKSDNVNLYFETDDDNLFVKAEYDSEVFPCDSTDVAGRLTVRQARALHKWLGKWLESLE